MATLNMDGPYTFDPYTINQKVTKKSAGNYALGYKKDDGTFIVCYVGRSDSDLNSRLHTQLIEHPHKMFKFSYAKSSIEAFAKECQNYHDFGGSNSLENEIHPDKPYAICNCPVCKC